MITLTKKITELVEQARVQVAMLITYFNIGKLIVEELQQGDKRAEYGSKLLKSVSTELS